MAKPAVLRSSITAGRMTPSSSSCTTDLRTSSVPRPRITYGICCAKRRARSSTSRASNRIGGDPAKRGGESANEPMLRNQGEWRALQGACYGAARLLLGTRPGERRQAPADSLQGRPLQGEQGG